MLANHDLESASRRMLDTKFKRVPGDSEPSAVFETSCAHDLDAKVFDTLFETWSKKLTHDCCNETTIFNTWHLPLHNRGAMWSANE